MNCNLVDCDTIFPSQTANNQNWNVQASDRHNKRMIVYGTIYHTKQRIPLFTFAPYVHTTQCTHRYQIAHLLVCQMMSFLAWFDSTRENIAKESLLKSRAFCNINSSFCQHWFILHPAKHDKTRNMIWLRTRDGTKEVVNNDLSIIETINTLWSGI